jgi:GntR family transcriptional regulator, trigonelline degradation regulator
MAAHLSLRVDRTAPSLRERAAVSIRNAILHMHLRPGQKLTDRQLCIDTGVSRSCVREALRQLEAEGLVTLSPGRGMFVAAVSVAEARQIYEVRLALETTFSRLFVERASDKDIAALKAACDAIERAMKRKPVTDYVQALDRFYDILLSGAGNDVARSMLRTLRARISYLRALTAQSADSEHEVETLKMLRAIVAAAALRDGTEMAKRCKATVERSARYAISVLSKQEESVSATVATNANRRTRSATDKITEPV